MSAASHTKISLDSPPELISAGYATHGHLRRESYCYEDYWSMHLYHYRVRLELDQQKYVLPPGGMSVISPGIRLTHNFDEPRCRHYYVLFRLPNRGRRFPMAFLHPSPNDQEIVASEFQTLVSELSRCASLSRARLWSILWRLSDRKSKASKKGSPAEELFRDAQQRILENLANPLTVGGLAQELDISHNHLTRLFRRFSNTTVVAYIREQRLARARYLLLQTTLPIKRVAFECGLSDLHFFNKLIRTHFGLSPRRFRISSAK